VRYWTLQGVARLRKILRVCVLLLVLALVGIVALRTFGLTQSVLGTVVAAATLYLLGTTIIFGALLYEARGDMSRRK
jgi:hypothetical protein